MNEKQHKSNMRKCPDNSKSMCEWRKLEEEMNKLQKEDTDKHRTVKAEEFCTASVMSGDYGYGFFNDEWNGRYDYEDYYQQNVLKFPAGQDIAEQRKNVKITVRTTGTDSNPCDKNLAELYSNIAEADPKKPCHDYKIKIDDPICCKPDSDPEIIMKTLPNIKDFSPKKKYEYVNHPNHYNRYPMEVIDMFERIYGKENTALWCEMTALKYRMRMGLKPDQDCKQDLEKEQWYLDKAAELRKSEDRI